LLDQLNNSGKEILRAKYEAGLAANRWVDPDNLFGRLHSPQDQLFQHHLAEAG